MYVVLAAIATGVEKLACCQPEAVSFLNVTLARSVPPFDQSFPVWVPVFCGPL